MCVAPATLPPLWAVPGPPVYEKRTPTAADAHDLKIVVKLRAVPTSKVPFPVEIAGFPDFSRPVPVYPAFLKYVVPVHKRGVQNCFPYGAVGLEQILCCKIDKTDDTCFEKTVLWTPRWSTDPYIGGSNFFEYNNLIFSLARKNPNILFVLRPHPLMFGNFIKTGEMTEQDVKQFKDYCQNENNIILDESKEYFNQFWNSDLLITDASGIVPEYFVTGRPILYCHSSANFIYNEYTLDIINTCYQVRSKEDLLHNFYRIIAGYDEKQNDRKALIRERYGDVQSNSRNILKVLKGENR